MTLNLPRLSLNKNSTFKELVPLDEPTKGWRASAYIKQRYSDKSPILMLEARLVENGLEIGIGSSKARMLKVGQFIYFVELIKGSENIVANNYLNVEP